MRLNDSFSGVVRRQQVASWAFSCYTTLMTLNVLESRVLLQGHYIANDAPDSQQDRSCE